MAAAGANKSSAPAATAAVTRKLEQVPIGAVKMSPAKDFKGPGTPLEEIVCWNCNEKGHRASGCPKRSVTSPSAKAASTSPAKAGKTVTFQTPKKQNGSILRRDMEMKRCDACCFIGVRGDLAPTLAVKAQLDSYSDCNLIPEQWLVALQGEGVETTELDVPIDITWS